VLLSDLLGACERYRDSVIHFDPGSSISLPSAIKKLFIDNSVRRALVRFGLQFV